MTSSWWVMVIACPSLVPEHHDDVIKWKHFPRHWPLVRGIHRPPVNSPHKGQWRGDLMFSLICAWINAWVNSREAGDLRRHRALYDVSVMHYLNQWPVIVRAIGINFSEIEWKYNILNFQMPSARIILCVRSANVRRRYIATSSLIGWAPHINKMIPASDQIWIKNLAAIFPYLFK